MWDAVSAEEGTQREQELHAFLQLALSQKATLVRPDNTDGSVHIFFVLCISRNQKVPLNQYPT